MPTPARVAAGRAVEVLSAKRLALESADATRLRPPGDVVQAAEDAFALLDRANPEHRERALRWLFPDEATRAVVGKLVG